MRLRAQPPVYSPLPLSAFASGVRALFNPRAAAARVEKAIRCEYEPHAVLLTDSGTSALSVGLCLATSERSGPAALPAFCCYDIATAVDAAAVPFLLYDIDPRTLAPDPKSLGRALAAGARTVVVVHLYGVPVDFEALTTLGQSGAVVLEDAAQAVGSRIGNRPAGALGRYGVLSFGRGKGVTGGRGGALLANNADAAAKLAAVKATLAPAGGTGAAALLAQWLFARPSLYRVPLWLPFLRLGETTYHAPRPPGHPPAFALGVLTCTQALVPTEAAVRRTHARRLLDTLAGATTLYGYPSPPGTQAGYLRLPVLVGEHAVAASRSAESRSLGIWPSYPRSLADLPGFGERRLNREETFPGARELARRLVTLPTHGRLHTRDLEALERWIARLSGRSKR